MTASEELTNLAARAKEAEDRVAAAHSKAKADLEEDVESARASAQARAENLRQTADKHRGRISDWWNDMQEQRDEHIAKIRGSIDSKKSEHDADRAEKHAQRAEDDAVFAVAYAYAAIDEAEYAVLDASLARLEADELKAGARA